MPDITTRLQQKLTTLYGADRAADVLQRITALLAEPRPPRSPYALSQRDAVLITYGDMVTRDGERPLETLRSFLDQTINGVVNTVHILPFYPYTSDDGFSVVDYFAVNPALGTWDDIAALRRQFRLMFDAVFNHVSASSAWFQAFLRDEAPYTDYFTVVDPATDLSKVRRPRALPLLTPFETPSGTKHVWTTFSADQIDVNAANPDLLVELLRALLFYVRQGADIIRLDAIAYLWKTIGTSCIHLPETHLIVQIMRGVLDIAAPDVPLITETNVPHDENISYFGDGTNEAQLVYQFSLPPLLLHTFRTGNISALAAWASTIQRASDTTTFFNFCASHDGIGVTPARGLLPDADIDALLAMVEAHGGRVSYKDNGDGTRSPYEMNITYFDAITSPSETARDPRTAVRRFLCSQAIMLAMVGVPGVYFHSLFGSRNWEEGVALHGYNRAVNRQKFDADALLAELSQPDSVRPAVFEGYTRLLAARATEPAFHPFGAQRVLDFGAQIFGLERTSPDGVHRVVALHNVSGESVSVSLEGRVYIDLLTRQEYGNRVTVTPYSVMWLKQM